MSIVNHLFDRAYVFCCSLKQIMGACLSSHASAGDVRIQLADRPSHDDEYSL